MSGPLDFLTSDTHLATRILKFRTEIDPECGKDFFGLHLNLRTKFQTEIELLSLTNFAKTFRSLGICLINKKSTPML